MSLDVSLYDKVALHKCAKCGEVEYEDEQVFTSNITHNLGEMASKAGIYYALWRPEEVDITTAKQLIEPLTEGLKRLKEEPEIYKKFNSDNGWGMYENFVPFVEEYLNACIEYPEATIYISR